MQSGTQPAYYLERSPSTMNENNSPDLTLILDEMGQREKKQKVERYRRLNQLVKPGQILFVGSSLMEQFPIQELLMDWDLPYTIYNRGIGGFTTQELAQVLDVCVYDLNPSHIFINIGTNDMNTPDYTLSCLVDRYEKILRSIQEHLPQAKLTLLAYYPLCEPVMAQDPYMKNILSYRNNETIRLANKAVEALAQRLGASFLDCNGGITDEQGNLKAEYTIEGMHIYGNGYAQILKSLLPSLEEAAKSIHS